MNDEDLKKALHAAHRDDAPPSVAALLARPRRRAVVFGAPVAAVFAVTALFVLCRPSPPDLRIPEWNDPLAGVLRQSGPNVYSDLPKLKGDWP